MARPDPKALQDAAAALRTQATGARRAVAEQLEKRDAEIGTAHDRAVQRQQVAEQAVKAAEETRRDETTAAQELRATAIDSETQAAGAEKKGDPNRAEELRESAVRLRARADAADTRAQAADSDTQNAKVELAEREREAHAIDRQMTDMNKASNTAERQLDVMEDKARLLDEAGRKLATASVTDNVVDRAQLENDAEKLLENANGLDVDVTGINAFTGGDIKVPELATQAIDTTAAADPAPSPDGDGTATAASAGLQDEFAQVAAGGPETPATDTATDAGATADPAPAPAVAAADAAPLDDPLGAGTAAGTDTALVGALQTDDLTGLADPAPAASPDVGGADTFDSTAGAADVSAPVGEPGTPTPELAPDPPTDVDDLAATDSFAAPDDPPADTSSVADDLIA
jgi:hypothetical protein